MQMAGRIVRSWQALIDQLAELGAGDPRLLQRFKEWVRTSPGTVSTKAAEALSQSPGVRIVLERDPQTLPLTTGAHKELQEALRSEDLPKDPEEYAALVERLCWHAAVFRRDDGGCPARESCDGDLELWTDGANLFQVCTACPTHYFDVTGHELTQEPGGLRPADRREILAVVPKAKRSLAW